MFKTWCKRWMAACLGAISLGAFAAPSGAPITLVVPYTPGTGIDLIARQLSANLPALLDQPVVVDNVPGASGNIGSEKVARAKPDGQTLLVQVNTLVMNRSLYKRLPYDPVNDFAPVAQTSWGTLLLVTNPKLHKAATVQEVVAEAKAASSPLNYATPGVGTPHHLSMALFLQRTGIEMLHVPYKGTAGAVTDLLGVPTMPTQEGRSLVNLMLGVNQPGPQVAFSDFQDERRVITTGRWKFLLRGNLTSTMFDLQQDPRERQQLPAGSSPVAQRFCRVMLSQFLGSTERGNWTGSQQRRGTELRGGDAVMDDEIQGQLRALGYAH